MSWLRIPILLTLALMIGCSDDGNGEEEHSG